MKKIFAVIVIAIIAIILLTCLGLNMYVKKQIIREAEKVLNTKVTVGSVDVAPFGGTVKIKNFAIENPQGFKNKNIFELSEVFIRIEKAKKIEGYWQFDIDDVIINNAQINNEVSQSGNNIAVLKEIIANKEEVTQAIPNQLKPITEESYKGKSKVLVAVDNLEIRNTKIDLSQNIIAETSSQLNIPNIKIRNIGTTDQPIFAEVAFRNVMEKFLNSVVQASVTSGIEGQLQGVLGGAIQDNLGKMGLENTTPAASGAAPLVPENNAVSPDASENAAEIKPSELPAETAPAETPAQTKGDETPASSED